MNLPVGKTNVLFGTVPEQYYILALNHGGLDQETEILKEFTDYNIKPLHGSYKGQIERSYMIKTSRERALEVATKHNQESILELGEMHPILGRKAQLVYISSNETQDLGHLRGVSKEEAEKSEAWTYDCTSGQYYLAK